MAKAAAVKAKTAFVCDIDGEPFVVHEGDVLPANHPAVKGRQELFDEVAVEQRT
jgi:hypothetical protein